MLTLLLLTIAIQWACDLQPYRPSPACVEGRLFACPDLLARLGHYCLVPVAVLPLPPDRQFVPLPERELDVTTQTGKQKAGGQNVNKVASAVRMVHRPTGLRVFINGRDQGANRKEALRILTAKVNDLRNGSVEAKYARSKSEQLASRGRGSKVRTYNFIDNFVADHRSGRDTRDVKSVMKGELELVL